MGENNNTVADKTDPVSKLYESMQSKAAPAQVGKPIFAKDLEIAKSFGASKMHHLIGKKLNEADDKSTSVPLNFGSRKSTGDMPEETRLRLLLLKKAVNNVEIQAQYKSRLRNPSKDIMMSVPAYKNTLEPMLKAFDIASFGQFIDEVQARFFFEEFEIPHILADQFDQMPMTSSLINVPGALGLIEGELESDTGSFTEQSNTESNYQVASKNNVAHTAITQDLLDDSSPALMEKLRRGVVDGVRRAYERAILDGATGTHIDADTQAGSAKLFTKAFDGLRKRIIDADAAIGAGSLIHDNAGALPSKDTFAEILKRLKGQGSSKDSLRYIMGSSVSHDLVTGAIPELFTAYAFGSLASNVTGQVPPVFGVKGIESELVREDLQADGTAAATPITTLTYMLIVNVDRYANWVRQATRVWAAPSLPNSDSMLMTAKARHAFAGTPMTADELNAAMAINIKTV